MQRETALGLGIAVAGVAGAAGILWGSALRSPTWRPYEGGGRGAPIFPARMRKGNLGLFAPRAVHLAQNAEMEARNAARLLKLGDCNEAARDLNEAWIWYKEAVSAAKRGVKPQKEAKVHRALQKARVAVENVDLSWTTACVV